MIDSDDIKRVTTELRLEMELDDFKSEEQGYRPVPDGRLSPNPPWRVRFDLLFGGHAPFGLEIHDEIIIGRYDADPNIVGLVDGDFADKMGISRKHLLIRPSESKLFLFDLGSTNGTYLNGTLLTPSMPYTLATGDRLCLGKLDLSVQIVGRPTPLAQTSELGSSKARVEDVVPQIARAMSAHAHTMDALREAMSLASTHAGARFISAALIDERSGVLTAAVHQEELDTANPTEKAHAQAAINLGAEAVRTGKPILIKRPYHHAELGQEMMETLFCLPIMIGGAVFGVLSGIHPGQPTEMTAREHKLLTIIVDLAASAVYNALQSARERESLLRRQKLIDALQYILAHDIRTYVKWSAGYTTSLNLDSSYLEFPPDVKEKIESLHESNTRLTNVIERLTEMIALVENPIMEQSPVNLTDMITNVMADLHLSAERKHIRLHQHVMGEPYIIQGDLLRLYRSLYHLVDNAIRYAPEGSKVAVTLAFGSSEIILRVRDDGEGFPTEDLPLIFERYYRGAASSADMSGLGLGLEYVRTVIEAHRGTVLVRNADGGGAEFIISLPISRTVDETFDGDTRFDTLPRNRLFGVKTL